MKGSLFVCFWILFQFGMAQTTEQALWVETGVKYEMNKRWALGAELNQRFGTYGLETFFPQVSLKYKVTKWLKPSVDYRYISSKLFDEPLLASQRINANLQADYTKKRWSFGLRVRYQFSFSRWNTSYDAEFDQAWRIKPSITYDINDFVLSPVWSAEFFYDPTYHQHGRQFDRIRYFTGFMLDLNSPHELGLGVYFDQWINQVPRQRVMYSIAYSYAIQKKKKKEKTSQKNNL